MDDVVGQMSDNFSGAAQDRHFQTVPLAEVDVHAGHDDFVMVVLLFDQLSRQLPRVVIVDDGDDGHLLGRGRFPLLADEAIADQVADRFAAVAVAAGLNEGIERRQQWLL